MITNNENRTFGVEVEFISQLNQYDFVAALNMQLGTTGSDVDVISAYYSDTDATQWRIKTDSSVQSLGRSGHGLELVTPILQGQQGHDDLVAVLKAMNSIEGCEITANRTCGLHVHVGVSDWKIGNFKNLFKRYAKFESTLDSIMPLSRRDSNGQYCESNVQYFNRSVHNRNLDDSMTNVLSSIDECTTLRKLSEKLSSRYVKLNVQSFWKHGTIEFRHHAGTTDSVKIANWLKLCMTMVQAADDMRTVKVKDEDTFATYNNKLGLMLKGLGKVENTLIDATVKRFFTKRRRVLCS